MEKGFSEEWNQRYQDQTHLSIWPWSDLIIYTHRYVDYKKNNFDVLELGCGAGANIPFFLKIGANYHSIEGSNFIVKKLKNAFPEISNNIKQGDFTKEFEFSKKFHLIVDRGSLTCNNTESIKNCIQLIYKHLEKNGIFIGIDWFSTENTEYERGDSVAGDSYTKINYQYGPFAETGQVHFSTQHHLLELFDKFKFKILEHKTIERIFPKENYNFATWNFVVTKEL